MELKDFIKGTITAISESVTELNEELGDKIAVSPSNVNWLEGYGPKSELTAYTKKNINEKNRVGIIHNVEFNLSITEGETSTKEGGVKIKVIDAGINSKKEKENLNSVKFSIPVAFF